MNLISFILIATLLLTFVPTIAIPYWTRKTESFGVTIPESFYGSEQLKQLRKQYALITGSLSLLIAIVFLLLTVNQDEDTIGIIFSTVIIVYLATSFLIYLRFHLKMKKIKADTDWSIKESQTVVIATNFRNEKLNYSNWWFLISIIPAIGIIIYTIQHYTALPNEIPMQFNFAGEVTSAVTKSYRSSLMLPIMQLLMTLLFASLNTVIAKAKQQIDSDNPKESIRRHAIFRKRWSSYIIITGNATGLLFFFLQLSLFYPVEPYVIGIATFGLTIFMVGAAIYLSIKTGQGGSRINHQKSRDKTDKISRDDDAHWKLGIFYFNRDDPTIFLEKRFGVGWTINLGQPMTWIIIILFIAFLFLLPFIFS